MHLHEVGIEHLATGIEITPTAGYGIRIETSSASLFMVSSDAPFTMYWPSMGCTAHSTNSKPFTSKKYTVSDITWYGNAMAEAMRKAYYSRNSRKSKLPRK